VFHLLEGVGFLGLVNDGFPVGLGLFESVDTSVVDLDGNLEDVNGLFPVRVGSDLEGFHLVGFSLGLLHGEVHGGESCLSFKSELEVVVVVLVGNGDLGLPGDNMELGSSESILSSLLGLDGDLKEVVVSLHGFVGLVFLSDSNISGLSGSVSLGFPVSSELLSCGLLDLLVVSNNFHLIPNLVSMDSSLDSGDSGDLSSDEVHLGVSGEFGLVDHDFVSCLLSVVLDLELLSGELNGDLPLLVLVSGVLFGGMFGDLSLSSVLDLDVSLPDGLLGFSLSGLSSGMGDLSVLDFSEHSGVFLFGFTGGNTGEVSVSVGSLLSLDGKTDGSSGLSVSDASVLGGKL
jgi:hypothetical protein